MGLLKQLLSWPVTGPLALTKFSMRQIEQLAKRELTDDASVREELMLLHMALDMGEIDPEEHRTREAELMLRLRDAREWRERLGMEEAWAPLEMRPSSREDDAPGGRDVNEPRARGSESPESV